MLTPAPSGIRGEYRSWDQKKGIWIPHSNIFTLVGWEQIIKAAFQHDTLDWDVGLCNTVPAVELAILDIGEPSGANGYLRQPLAQNDTDWPTIGNLDGESFITSKTITFPATGAYSGEVSRLFITDGVDVISVSSAFPEPILYAAPSMHQYRLYFR